MKIVSLTAENVKRIRAVYIEPDGNTVVISGRNGQGKQQPVSEPVLTPHGWRRIGDLRDGDEVIGSDGTPTRILDVFPQTDQRVLTVRMSDGTSTRVGHDHKWSVLTWRPAGHRRHELRTEIHTTDELLAEGLHSGSHRRWSIPLISAPVQFADSGENLPVDPYTLGVILGDGHIEPSGYVTITSWDQEIFDWIKVDGWRDEHNLGTAFWSRPLVHLGLAGRRSWEKFIPDCYLRGSVEDRRALLAGLMDTDGTVPESWASFATSSEALADGFVDLGSSLGHHCIKRANGPKRYRLAGELKTGRPSWIVMIKGAEPPFRLDRKNRRWKKAVQRPEPRRFIEAIEPAPDEESVCIRVEARDGLYVTNDWIVTHNSSILDSIWMALGGGPAAKDTTKPIRDGETEARVELDLGELVVTRTWKDDKTTLAVRATDGAKYSSPQSMLDDLVGRLSFDPLEFAQQPARDQLATLLGMVDLPFDPSELDAQRAGLYEQRTEVGREIRSLTGQLDGLPTVAGDLPPTEVGLTDLLQRRVDAVAELGRNDEARQRAVSLAEVVESAEADVKRFEESLDHARGLLSARREDLRLAKVALEDIEDPDIAGLDQKLATLDETNRKVRARDQRLTVEVQLERAVNDQMGLSEQITAIDESKTAALAEAKMPIDGLSFDADGVTYQGVPFKQCSSAEQLRVSVAMAMALNPKVRVIRIADGSLLDSENLALIEEMADASDFQIWLERVDESGSVGVVIEDGMVAVRDFESATA